MADLLDTEDHPQDEVARHGEYRVMAMDSARYVDASNTGSDVVVPASYLGVLPARLMAPHRPRAVIGHDGRIGKDGAGIQGLYYLEALGIPAAAADGATAELGNGRDLYDEGVISRVNILAENCGVTPGMTVVEAARLLCENDPGATEPGTRIRREVVETGPDGRQVVVTDSIIFARPEDRGRNVLVTAGHTGTSGASFLLEFRPWGFICSDGGGAKNDSGIAGLDIVAEHGLAGASVDGQTAALGDAFSSYHDGIIAACNEPARARGVEVGMPAARAASLLLAHPPAGDGGGSA
ncbi:hypothetical protein [Euzebya tangerina]|uniref:hypothetical protein n=1 Tax=Euzebya tangerina TaxID=591198 RepID=UPI00196B0EA9|nr:hypothetical protein [Euzebya tangerina]